MRIAKKNEMKVSLSIMVLAKTFLATFVSVTFNYRQKI